MTFINTEEMHRAAITFDNAVDQMARVVNHFEGIVYQMQQAVDKMAELSVEIGKMQNKPFNNKEEQHNEEK